ncbi:hypothetical protein GGR56DRAFT_331577 [Xylariaceae sp. FL0804]|nr:hypothetical protein GGR56DRAFT_331577 [Xylariaceae sp. FL0804]
MTESWTNQTVQFQTISKAAPALDNQIYWTDASTSSLYTWAGSTYSADQPPNAMWRLAADGNGGGEWSEVEQQDFREFSSLVRPVGAAFTQGNSVGYALGGATTPPMDDESTASGSMGNALTGLVSYNLETGQWANSSSAAYGGYGTSLNALAEFVPFGPDGLLLFLGGAESPVEATNETIQQMSLDTVTLYDPASNTWYTQTTSGDRPPTMQSACSVGVQGPNNTYEIFIYGGSSDQLEGTSPDVTVLSLPGFVFVQGESGTPRSDHACAVVGRGRRQMLSVGGVDGTNRTYTAPSTADPWAQGLGIYDMTAMRWTASYDPGAAAYDSPAAVKQWYAGGGQQGVRWDDSGLEALMLNGSTQTGAPQQSPSKSAHGSKNQTGAIAGGVVGGVALLALLAGLAFWLRRRRRQRQRQNPGGTR